MTRQKRRYKLAERAARKKMAVYSRSRCRVQIGLLVAYQEGTRRVHRPFGYQVQKHPRFRLAAVTVTPIGILDGVPQMRAITNIVYARASGQKRRPGWFNSWALRGDPVAGWRLMCA